MLNNTSISPKKIKWKRKSINYKNSPWHSNPKASSFFFTKHTHTLYHDSVHTYMINWNKVSWSNIYPYCERGTLIISYSILFHFLNTAFTELIYDPLMNPNSVYKTLCNLSLGICKNWDFIIISQLQNI